MDITMNHMIDARRNALKGLMDARNLKHILVLNPGIGNIDCWLFAGSGVPTPPPFNRNSAYIVPAEGEVIKLCQTTTHPTDQAQFPKFDETDLSEVFSVERVGIIHPQFLKKNVRDHLAAAYPGFIFEDVTADFAALKAVKNTEELTAIRAAAVQYDLLFDAMGLILRAERLEKEAVNEIRQRLSWQGAESETPGFHSMVRMTSAPDGAVSAEEPMMWPGRRLLVGDRVNVTVKGYLRGGFSAVLGRSFVLGAASDEAKACWDLAVEAQDLAASLAKPGACLKDIAGAVNGFLQSRGLPADEFGWIHGMGVAVYEEPRNIDASNEMPLAEGMVLSIGPEVKPAQKDGYCCVDPFVVTPDGAVRLSATARALRELF